MYKMGNKYTKREFLRDEHSWGLRLMVWVLRVSLLSAMAVGICKFPALPIDFKSAECAVILAVYLILLVTLQNVYHACDIGRSRVSELVVSQTLSILLSAGVLCLGMVLYLHTFFAPVMLMTVAIIQTVLAVGWNLLVNYLYYKLSRKPRTLVICQNEEDYELLCQTEYFHLKYDVVHVISDIEPDLQGVHTWTEDCDVVFIVCVPTAYAHEISKLCLTKGIKVYFTPRIGQTIMAGATHRADFSIPLLQMERAGRYKEYRVYKRIFDIVCAVIGLFVCSPVMLVTALAIWLEDHGPVFYSQVRLTKDGREFRILKFRSMRVNAEQNGVARLATQNDSRITKVGKVIRACRIDELPQLINILVGDMSIVGPRPERPEIAKQYEQILPEFFLRLQVKAGLTGFAQVYGHYNTNPYHKLQMDLMYINQMSFIKDLQLILLTVRILFQKERTQGVARDQVTAMSNSSGRGKDSD